MLEIITLIIVGILVIIIGIFNRKGNIKMMHSYHYKRVSKKDIIPFSKMVGFGMIIIGLSIFLYAMLYCITLLTNIEIFTIIANVLLIISNIIGIIIIFVAMFKYNKGIF